MKNVIKILTLSLTALFLLTGCIATKSYDFKPGADQLQSINNSKTVDYKVVNINVSIADENSRGDIDAIPDILVTNLKSELDRTIIESNVFNISSDNDVNVKVIINEVDSPLISNNFPTKMKAQYILLKDNNELFNETIESLAETEFSYSFLGGTRQMESVNRTVRQNIINFLKTVENKLGN